jgi:hypothetical protein
MSPDLPLHVSWFPTARPNGPAYGCPRDTTWGKLCGALQHRREGEKDGPNLVPARFKPENNGKVRRLGRNVVARTAVALDLEYNSKTGEFPPPFALARGTLRQSGWAAILYTSHNHVSRAPRYRILLPLSAPVDPLLPVVEVAAEELQLGGVLDRSKLSAASLFFLPSCPLGQLNLHDVAVIDGDPVSADWICEIAGRVLAEREVARDRVAAEAHKEAEARRQAKIAAGADPDDSLIEKIRGHLDLTQILLAHGYDRGPHGNWRHPNSQSGSYGAYVANLGGIDRVFSHNAGDPLHPANLPAWCGVAAVDAVDVAIVLDYGGDRKRGLHELAKRFGLDHREQRRELARLIFRMDRQGASQAEIEAAAFADGARLGLSRAEIADVVRWVAFIMLTRSAA